MESTRQTPARATPNNILVILFEGEMHRGVPFDVLGVDIGTVYQQMRRHDKAVEYLHKVIFIADLRKSALYSVFI